MRCEGVWQTATVQRLRLHELHAKLAAVLCCFVCLWLVTNQQSAVAVTPMLFLCLVLHVFFCVWPVSHSRNLSPAHDTRTTARGEHSRTENLYIPCTDCVGCSLGAAAAITSRASVMTAAAAAAAAAHDAMAMLPPDAARALALRAAAHRERPRRPGQCLPGRSPGRPPLLPPPFSRSCTIWPSFNCSGCKRSIKPDSFYG